MPYYGAGDYYGAGGIGSFLKSAVRTVASVVVPRPIQAIASPIVNSLTRTSPLGGQVPPPLINPPFGGAPGAGIGRIGTPAHMATVGDRRFYTRDGRARRIRRDGKPWSAPRLNPTNPRALRRAGRRLDSFVNVARGALKNTKYGIYTRSSRSSGKKKK